VGEIRRQPRLQMRRALQRSGKSAGAVTNSKGNRLIGRESRQPGREKVPCDGWYIDVGSPRRAWSFGTRIIVRKIRSALLAIETHDRNGCPIPGLGELSPLRPGFACGCRVRVGDGALLQSQWNVCRRAISMQSSRPGHHVLSPRVRLLFEPSLRSSRYDVLPRTHTRRRLPIFLHKPGLG
jgi:hypothetical protein